MRTIEEIKNEMIRVYLSNDTVRLRYGISDAQDPNTYFSHASIENILFYSFAFGLWAVEGLFNKHKSDVEDAISLLKPHSLRWYRKKSIAYLHGVSLVPEADYYDTSAIRAEDIYKAKIVKYCAVSEDSTDSRLFVKIAGEKDSKRAPIGEEELQGFKTYLSAIKDAGVMIEVVNRPADNLRLSIEIHYNPLVLDSNGKRVDGNGDNTIGDAVKHYAENLPFNGEFTLSALTDVLQLVEGVVIAQVLHAASRYGDREYEIITTRSKPDSGYFTIDNIEIRYIAYEGSDL